MMVRYIFKLYLPRNSDTVVRYDLFTVTRPSRKHPGQAWQAALLEACQRTGKKAVRYVKIELVGTEEVVS